MRVEMTVSLAGPLFVLQPGDQHDFPQDEALRLIAKGYAVPATQELFETTTLQPSRERRDRRGKSKGHVVSTDGH